MRSEALQGVKTVVMDKTGTITEGNFVVQKCVANEMEEGELLRLAAVCEKNSTHPIGNEYSDGGGGEKAICP